jgi:hypothetical protein
LIAPVTHDFYYQTQLADYKGGISQDGGQFQLDKKTLYLNDQDEQWAILRSHHFLEAYQAVN